MKKHLHLKKVLATLLIIAAVFAGQQAFATVTETITIKGQKQSNGNISYFAFEIQSIWGSASLPGQQGSSYTFNNTNLPGRMVTLNGTLNFQEATQLTDVVTGSTFTVTVENREQWFYSATVKTLSGTTVTDCSVTVSDDQNTITVSIPSGKTFGQIILDYVTNEPFNNNNNTVIGGIESEYIYTGSPIEPVPTVTYNGTVLTAGTDYTVSYANNNALGTATLTVTGTGQYAGTITRNYNIRAVTLSDFNSLGNNTYEIATTTDLDHLAVYVNLGNNCQDLTFKQTADIAYTYTTAWNNSSSTENNYTAIGTNATPFRGTFDGQNYSISGIRVYKGDTSLQGLFGELNNSTVKHVNLANARITGESYVGGIAGDSFLSIVEDCTVADNVTIHAVVSNTSNHAGIVGSNQGTVRRCISHATLSVASNMVGGKRYGGVVGYNFNGGSVTDCIAIGAIVPNIEDHGAIAGKNQSSSTLQRNFYRNCTVAGTANATNVGCGGTDIITNQGALALYSLTLPDNVTTDRTASAILPGTGNKTYTTGADINGTPYYCQGGTVTLVYNNLPEGYRANYTATGGTINGNILTMPAANVTVTVALVPDWSGSGTQTNPYVITTTAQLDALANEVKSGQTYSGTYFVLGNDIAYSTAGLGDTDENFIPIGGYFDGSDKNFSGTFNGQNHTISGIRLYKNGTAAPSMNQGLFGRIDGATIENVILADARITGYRYVGGLVGNKVSGTVQNCLVLESTITCANTYVGALFGKNNGTITSNYYHNCTVNGTANATNVGVGGNGGTSSSSDKNGARSAHTLTLGENVTATGESVAYQGTTYYASNTTVTLGYNNLPAGYTVTYSLNGTALTGNTFTMPANDNATVNASTALITYNITYDLDGGSVATANPTTYNVTTPTFTLNNPTKAGYTFTGWTGSNGTTPQTTVTIAQGSTGNLNYTAHWSLNTYNITYNLDGGSVATANPTTYNVQTPTFTLTNPTRAACNFDGWTGTDLTEPTMTVTIAQGSTGDRDYTTHWTQYAGTLTLGTDITASGTVAFTLDGTDYYATGTEITLAYSGNIPENQHIVFYVNGAPIANNGNTFAMPAANATISVAFHDWPGSGKDYDPYIISTTAELHLLAYAMSYDYYSDGKYFKLGADIAYDPNELDANGTNYTPIGRSDTYLCWFYGSFDGDSHTISGIRSSLGLFDQIGEGGIVKNVTLADAVINGNENIGGIAGINSGHIENCRVINTVINGSNYYLGGIAGKNTWGDESPGHIENCQVINTVCNGNAVVGGITGWLEDGQIENCQIINTDINGNYYLGGIAGVCNAGTTIENCLVLDTDITATQYNGAIVGDEELYDCTLTSNYYHGCSVNNETSGIGTGGGDITGNDGAVQAFSLGLGDNVTATPDPAATYDGTSYYTAGTGITLAYGGTIPEGSSFAYSLNGNALTGNTFTMPAADAVVSAILQVVPVTQTITLESGWNWWSTNVDITLDDLKAALVAALPGATSITIKSQTGSTSFNGNIWRGALNTMDVALMYEIQVPSSCTITLTGMPIDPSEHSVNIIANGNTWIGFPLNESKSVDEAFGTFPVAGDIIKSKGGRTTYTGTMWRGTLENLEPGQGYIYKSNVQGDRTFTFPSSTK